MKSCTKERTALCALRTNSETVAGEAVHYGLYEGCFAMPQYYVEIKRGGERAAAYLGEERERAEEIYAALVRGTVTPCTLQAIIEDFL